MKRYRAFAAVRSTLSAGLVDHCFCDSRKLQAVQRSWSSLSTLADAWEVGCVSPTAWAPMVHQRTRFAEFKRDYQLKHPDSDLEFHYIDCTPVASGYEPLRSLHGWQALEEENSGTSLVHGYGELVWCQNARVLHVERPLNFESTDALIVKTESLGMANVAK